MRIGLIMAGIMVLTGGTCTFLAARKYGIGLELTRNAAANQKARASQGNAYLQTLAANPKLTVVRQSVSAYRGGKRNPTTLCVLNRHILSVLSNSASASSSTARPLLSRLESVNIEPVAYDRAEVPSLITELTAVNNSNPSSAFAGDLKNLITGLEQGNNQASEVVFY